MSDLSILAKEENNRILDILTDSGVKQSRIDSLRSIIENVAWMKIKLDAARDAIKNSNVVIPYDNGGGQKGLRENPMYKGYESLWKSYMSGMDKILSCLPQPVAETEIVEEEKPKTILEIIRERHAKEA